MPGQGSHTTGRRRCGTTLGALGASAPNSGHQGIFFFFPFLSLQLCLLGRESPKDSLTHYTAAYKCTS